MRRRTLLQAAIAAPFVGARGALAQVPGKHRIGMLIPGVEEGTRDVVPAFLDGLRDFGYVEGRNLVIERRFSGASEDRLVEAARELVKLDVEVILAAGPSAARVAREATTAVPIVM